MLISPDAIEGLLIFAYSNPKHLFMRKSFIMTLCAPAVIAVMLGSCRPLYIPNALHTPMVTEKNEVNATVLLGSSGLDAQVAWSPGKHWAIMLDGSFYQSSAEDSIIKHRHYFGEGGAGYHTSFGIGRFDVYGGGGYGFASAANDSAGVFSGSAQGNYWRAFVQPSIGIGTDIVDVNLAVRTSYVSFANVKTTGMNLQYTHSLFFEPALTVRVGYKWVKLFIQAGLSVPASNRPDVQHQPLILMTGVNLNFNKWKNAGL